MTEAEIVSALRAHMESQFPRKCSRCGQQFATLRDYWAATQPLGQTIPYDAIEGDWRPQRPLGAVAYANCACGNTLALSTAGMPLAVLWEILGWIRTRVMEHGESPVVLVESLRQKVRDQLEAEARQGAGGSETTTGR